MIRWCIPSNGIGRYQGLINLDLGEGSTEFLHLKYAGDATLYVPVAQLHVIGRYSGANPEDAPLHQLGSGAWEKAKRRAAEQARDTAAELLNLYARRALRQGHGLHIRGQPTTSCLRKGSASRKPPTNWPPSMPWCRT